MNKTWKPVVAGAMDIVTGFIVGLAGIAFGVFMIGGSSMWTSGQNLGVTIGWFVICLSLAYGFFTIHGGVVSIRRKRWRPALIASILSALTVIGIPLLILTIASRAEFGPAEIIKVSHIYKKTLVNPNQSQKVFVAENGLDLLPGTIGCNTCQFADPKRYIDRPWCNAPNLPDIKGNRCSEYKLKRLHIENA